MWADDGTITSINDWELAGAGDPLLDLAYYLQVQFPGQREEPMPLSKGLSREEIIETYTAASGIEVRHLEWYEVVNCLKLASILYGMQHTYDAGESEDPRFSKAGHRGDWFLRTGLARVGG